ncbi:MAG TPA: hypothetical protein VIJ28_08035 [Chloroflexota bacterium]
MLDTRQIHPLTDFLRNHKAHMARLKETRIPEVLTVNGRAELVVQDAGSYQSLLDRLRHMETLTAIREGIASAERGEMKPAEQIFAEMRAKYGLQD